VKTTNCTHDGFHSGQGRYIPATGRLRYVVICDDCGSELREVTELEYRPDFDPHGNDQYLQAA
jgi:hypothetical protein